MAVNSRGSACCCWYSYGIVPTSAACASLTWCQNIHTTIRRPDGIQDIVSKFVHHLKNTLLVQVSDGLPRHQGCARAGTHALLNHSWRR